jgi:hypothetical protein
MAKYQLLVDHYIGQALVPAGTEIDTSEPAYANFKPSMHTAGVDHEGKQEVERRAKRRRRDPVQALPTGFAPNGDVRAEDVPGNPAPVTYSVSTPGQAHIPPTGGTPAPRVGDIEVASTAPDPLPAPKPVPGKK